MIRPVTALLAFCVIGATLPAARAAQPQTYASPAAQAAATNKPVELTAQDTETDTVFVNPDGSYTRTIESTPTRVWRGGKWVSINYALQKQADGTLAPTVAPDELQVSLSGGGAQPLIVERVRGVTVKLTWPGKLPTPTVSGASALYAGILPGVDLRLTVSNQGVSQLIIVNTPAARSNPALRQLTLGTTVTGGSLTTSDGGLALKDDTGKLVAQAPEPTAWDSSGGAVSAAQGLDRSEGPIDGDSVTEVGLSTASGKLALAPATSALASTAKLPIYIDPSVAPLTSSSWAMLSAQSPNTPSWKWSDKTGQGVGFQTDFGADTSKKRLLWRFDIPDLKGAVVTEATFTSYMIWSSSCKKGTVDLLRIPSFGPHTTWNDISIPDKYEDTRQGKVTVKGYAPMVSASQDAAAWSACPVGEDGMPLEFGVKSAVQDVADAGGRGISFLMRARDETDKYSWKRMRSRTTLSITYNHRPAAPSQLEIGTSGMCNGYKQPALHGTPRLYAKLNDADHDPVRMQVTITGTSGAGKNLKKISEAPYSNWSSPGHRASLLLWPIIKENGWIQSGTYTVQAQAQDQENTKLGLWSAKSSAKCTFTVDATAPAPPDFDPSPSDQEWVVNQLGYITVNPGDEDTYSYSYSLDGRAAVTVDHKLLAKDGSYAIPVKLTSYGQHTMVVRAYDQAGNPSPPAKATFETTALDLKQLWSYSFDSATGTSVVNEGGTAPAAPMALSSSALVKLRGRYVAVVGTPAKDDRMLRLSDAVKGRGVSALSLRPDQSFSVGAWLNPTVSTGRTLTAVGYGDASTEWVRLGVDKDGYYFFSVYDVKAKAWRTIKASVPVDDTTGFRQVIGGYDVLSGRLYVAVSLPESGQWDYTEMDDDDKPVSALPSTFSSGHLEVGDGSWPGAAAETWVGDLDQVDVLEGWADENTRNHVQHRSHPRSYICGAETTKDC